MVMPSERVVLAISLPPKVKKSSQSKQPSCVPPNIVIPLPFQQQIAKYLIKFEILTSALGFLFLKFLIDHNYNK
jgi:hypothetical protein